MTHDGSTNPEEPGREDEQSSYGEPPEGAQPSYGEPPADEQAQGVPDPQAYPPPPGSPDPQAYPPPPGYGQQPPPGYGPPPQGYGAPYGQMPGYPGAYVDPNAKSKLAAGLLGIFLGGFGVHRFYLGYVGIGIAQIAVTLVTCGLGSLWGLIEGILYLVGSSGFTTDAEGRPLRD